MEDSKLLSLKAALEQVHEWPSMYLFKFIVPSENQKVAQLEALFNSETAEIRLRQSKNGKYTSVSAREVMTSSDEIIALYEEAYKIEGVISL